jgi:hypothetical protein
MQAEKYVFGEFPLLSDAEMDKSPSRELGMSREEEEKQLNQSAAFILKLAEAIHL